MIRPLDLADLPKIYGGKRVLVTGHTGFKGSWLTVWLRALGAEVTGLALAPPSQPALFDVLELSKGCAHHITDVRDAAAVARVVNDAKPDVVFHLAAQSLVRPSYERPLETLDVNVMGTANVLEAVRAAKRRCAVIVVTSDKCYENKEWVYGYRETDPMGGHDVYSMSKGAAELVTSSWRRSFFPPARFAEHGVALASVRAGNVIGGGDWAVDRIVPDAARALAKGEPIVVRNPHATRPWQHVLEPLGGYLLLAARILNAADPAPLCDAWNFGPASEGARPVRDLVDGLVAAWGEGAWEDHSNPNAVHEAGTLKLSIDKATSQLGWRPRWGFEETVKRTVAWYRAHARGAAAEELYALTETQLREYAA